MQRLRSVASSYRPAACCLNADAASFWRKPDDRSSDAASTDARRSAVPPGDRGGLNVRCAPARSGAIACKQSIVAGSVATRYRFRGVGRRGTVGHERSFENGSFRAEFPAVEATESAWNLRLGDSTLIHNAAFNLPVECPVPMLDRRHFLATSISTLFSCGVLADARSPSLAPATGPYALPGTFVHPLPDPVSGRRYEAWIDVPTSIDIATTAPRPAVFVTDAPYAFPLVRSIRNRVGQAGRNLADFVLVGLAPAADESSADMRNRAYTPTNPRARPAQPGESYQGRSYGEGADYLRYLADIAVPAVSAHYNLDPARRVILGHSYGALLATQVLFERSALFSHYILGSPSLWFDQRVMFAREESYAKTHNDLKARVFQYVGEFEAIGPRPRFNEMNDLVRDARWMDRKLRGRHYPSLRIETHVLTGEDHLTVAPRGATSALLWALPGHGPYGGG